MPASSREVLPSFYVWVLSRINPAITFFGVLSCVLDPLGSFIKATPPGLGTRAIAHAESKRIYKLMLPLGQGYLYLVLLALLITRLVKHDLAHMPEVAEKVTRVWILVTLIPEPLTLGVFLYSLSLDLSIWRRPDLFQFFYTIFITIVKTAWLFGVGRARGRSKQA